ncbi:MAG: GreA/GreB family elongation factor [Herbinix sp.]|nr:GreA/GreB family elongation factor [Herbinix sp.]
MISITQHDKDKLRKLIDDVPYIDSKLSKYIKDLEHELSKAKILRYDQISRDVITMNSKVLLLIDDEEEEITLVYPEAADVRNNKLSVLSPIGTAILGYREGNSIEWEIPNGKVHLVVKKVIYQPEACGIIDD